MSEQAPGTTRTVEVVALVASAGGLDALTTVLQQLPPDLPAAVVVQQHLSGRPSQLVPILRQRAGLAIDWAEDGASVAPGHVLVAPARRALEFVPDGTVAIGTEPLHVRDRPHDALLNSLADAYADRALAVVLTGMGTDGAGGVRALLAVGATVLVQSAETSDQASMPLAAIDAGAELVLPLHQLGRVVTDVVTGRPLPRPGEEVDAIRTLFGEHGQIAELAREVDWPSTPVGRVSQWPTALRGAVQLAMDTPTPTAVMWGEQNFLFVNEAAVEPLSGRHRHAFGRPHRDAFPEVWDDMRPLLQATLRGERPQVTALHLPFEQGGRIRDAWLDLSHAPIRDADGDVVGVYEAFFDRTVEVLASRRLGTLNGLAKLPVATTRRAALAAAVTALGESSDVVFAVAYLVDKPVTRAALVGAAGVAAGGPMAPREIPLDRPGAWPLTAAGDGELLVTDLAARFRGHLVGPDDVVPEAAVLFPVRDQGTDTMAGVLVLGVNPRLDLDTEYRQFLTLVGETVTSKVVEAAAWAGERARTERLAELDRAKTEFFSNVSHEFRTPLTLMLGPLEQLLSEPGRLDDEARPELELVQRNARRLLRLVGTLLDFSQSDAARLRPRLVETDLAAATADIAAMFRSAVERTGLDFTVDTPPLPRPAWVDPEMWEKVVSNLLSNALKFTWTGGIEVVLRAQPHHAELTVRDTGVGVPVDDQPHVFSRFHRVGDTRGRTFEGAGIGLALVAELIRLHHGRVRLRSDAAGSEFTVWLPFRRVEVDAPQGEPGPTGQLAAAMADEAATWNVHRERARREFVLDDDSSAALLPAETLPGARVLVADDNADMRDYLVRLLGSTWAVTTASDGREALDAARAEPPELVLADVMMPGLDGAELLQHLRADPATATIPVVLLTARAAEQSAIDALLAGADDYIVKPFSARELVARLTAQLELARQRAHSESRWRAVVDASFDVVYRMNPDWTQMRALAGQGFLDDTAESSDSWLQHYIHPDDQARVLDAIECAVRERSVFELEHRVLRPDGSLGRTLSRAVPLLDERGEIEEWVGTATDVTDRRA